jgi:FlaA1/EpsC-like NDP-sugar epimerase
MRLGGLPVLGTIKDLPSVARASNIDEVLITMPSASGRATREVVNLAQEAGVPCRIVPSMSELLLGKLDISRIRSVRVEDLLRRETVELDEVGLHAYLEDRVILVTGAGGSIGSEIVRQTARFRPTQIVLLGRGEHSLHLLQQELRIDCPDLEHVTVVGNVCDQAKMEEVLERFRPHVVFHAAAHKHVPMMEYNPDEAILNNVAGTRTLAQASVGAGVQRFVNISTDKAVNPASMVGYTKHLAERVVRNIARGAGRDQAFVSVRFGNVLGSRGSVVPVFQEQIRRGGPLMLTDPVMTRYFMTITEASRLVIQAGALATNGAVYVLDMGQPVRILDLARDLLRLSGSDEEDVEIIVTGPRQGEKLHEELFTEAEVASATRYEKILMARDELDSRNDLDLLVDELTSAAAERDWEGMGVTMARLVPAYNPRAMTGLALS